MARRVIGPAVFNFKNCKKNIGFAQKKARIEYKFAMSSKRRKINFQNISPNTKPIIILFFEK
jgi:hypothetical protein